jgi:hypothetical protein
MSYFANIKRCWATDASPDMTSEPHFLLKTYGIIVLLKIGGFFSMFPEFDIYQYP